MYGGGTVDGSGAPWWPNKHGFRPTLVKMEKVNTLLISDVTFIDSPNHNLELFANDAELAGVTVTAPGDSPNTDAVDVHGAVVVACRCMRGCVCPWRWCLCVGPYCVKLRGADVAVVACRCVRGCVCVSIAAMSVCLCVQCLRG